MLTSAVPPVERRKDYRIWTPKYLLTGMRRHKGNVEVEAWCFCRGWKRGPKGPRLLVSLT